MRLKNRVEVVTRGSKNIKNVANSSFYLGVFKVSNSFVSTLKELYNL